MYELGVAPVSIDLANVYMWLRVDKCMAKVQAIKGSNKATTVFSTAKFPLSHNIPSLSTFVSIVTEVCVSLSYLLITSCIIIIYVSIFVFQLPSTYREAGDEQYFPASTKLALVGNPNLNVEAMTILSRLNSYGTDMERVEFIIEDQGLGTLPEYIPSVGSLLLFNSSINLYKDYQTQDNLMSTGR